MALYTPGDKYPSFGAKAPGHKSSGVYIIPHAVQFLWRRVV